MPRIERLNADHQVEDFSSGNDDLDTWLRTSGQTADRAGSSRVYVRIDDDDALDGYFAIVPHVVRRADLPSAVGRGSPDSVPGFLLARLALSDDRQGVGKGGELLVDALAVTLDAIRVGGGRLIVVDAIDHRAHGFYEHFGFRPLPEDDGRLVMKASTAAASVGVAWP